MLSVLLAGVAAYRHMPQLPSVLNNLVDLQALFGGAAVVVADPETPAQLIDPLAHLAAARVETLVCYFGGHGVRDMDGRLCLALPGTIDKKADAQRTAVSVERVLAVLSGARARNRIVVLDCCFSGLAMRAPSACDLHLVTATGRTEKALAPPETRHTLFSGGLIDVLRHGIPDGGEWITVGELYRWSGGGEDDPVAHQRSVDLSADTPLLRNPAHGTASTGAGLARRAELATRVGWRDPARAAGLLGRIVGDAQRATVPAAELAALRMAEAAWVGASGDVPRAVACWAGLRGSAADPGEVERNLAYWRGRLPS